MKTHLFSCASHKKFFKRGLGFKKNSNICKINVNLHAIFLNIKAKIWVLNLYKLNVEFNSKINKINAKNWSAEFM